MGPEMTGTRARVLVELSGPPGAAVDTHSIDRETIYADFLKLSSYMMIAWLKDMTNFVRHKRLILCRCVKWDI